MCINYATPHLACVSVLQVQHAIPAAAAVAKDDMTGTEVIKVVEGTALGTEEQKNPAVRIDGVDSSKKEEEMKGHEEDCEEKDEDRHHEEEAMAREIEAKLVGIAQQEEVLIVVDSAAAADAGGAKPPVEEERRGSRGVTRKAKAVVVPIDDDDELDGEAAEQGQAAADAPEAVELGPLTAGRQEPKREAPQEGKAHE